MVFHVSLCESSTAEHTHTHTQKRTYSGKMRRRRENIIETGFYDVDRGDK